MELLQQIIKCTWIFIVINEKFKKLSHWFVDSKLQLYQTKVPPHA